MKIEFIENTPSVLRFKIKGVSTAFANGLRRIAINSVHTFAINTVTMYENTSAMFDEYIAHRIGMIPIVTPKGYDEKDEILLSLDAEGPKTVYSKDLVSNEKDVEVGNENIPIIKLAKEQRLRLAGKAVMGNAMKSSKFQPGLVTYKALDKGDFEFYIEAFGQMSSREILNRALDIINEELKAAHKEFKK